MMLSFSRLLHGAVALIAVFSAATTARAATTIQPATYHGHTAYRMTDGRTEALIVPDLSRVMRYGFVGGQNILWNAATPDPAKPIDDRQWTNWGGDKTWIGPQSSWPMIQNTPSNWPPDTTLASLATAELLPGNALRLTTRVSDSWGARIIREYRFRSDGAFEVNQIVEKVSGPKMQVTVWDVFQSQAPDAIFLPLNVNSVYKNGYVWLITPKVKPKIPTAGPDMTRIAHSYTVSYKIGMDSPVARVVAVKNGQALVLRAALPPGDYPDGALGSGFPVEFYNQQDPGTPYDELELLGPLTVLAPGEKASCKITWQLYKLPTRNAQSPVMAHLAHTWLYGK
jgi:hypothetical protein